MIDWFSPPSADRSAQQKKIIIIMQRAFILGLQIVMLVKTSKTHLSEISESIFWRCAEEQSESKENCK